MSICNQKIDNAASEKEESVACAESKEVQGKTDELMGSIKEIDDRIALIDMEFSDIVVDLDEMDYLDGFSDDEIHDPFDELSNILGQHISCHNEESMTSEKPALITSSDISPAQKSAQQDFDLAIVIADKPTPTLMNKVSKGSKTNIDPIANAPQINVCLGWHTNCCDVDVSAFMLDANSKSLGEEWFVFYGQTQSPDGALSLNNTNLEDMQSMFVNFAMLDPNVKRIVFVLTINEALQRHQNFSMIFDAYIRIMDSTRNVELVSFPITEYYPTITSMMVGELYQYNGNWKFNAIGNGVARDLAGLCEFYGIETT